MPRRMSNADRIARARAEADATQKEKELKKAAKAAAPAKTTRRRTAATPERRKVVWAVAKHGAEPAAIFPYPQKAAAEADAAGRGEGWVVKAVKVPMDD